MKKSVNRKAILVSAVVTTLVLVGVSTAVLTANPPTVIDPQAGTASVTMQSSVSDTPQTLTPDQAAADIAAYRAQLSQAYQALEQAYAQIDTLQSGQGRGEHDHAAGIIMFEHEDDHD